MHGFIYLLIAYSPAWNGVNSLRSGNNQCSAEEINVSEKSKEWYMEWLTFTMGKLKIWLAWERLCYESWSLKDIKAVKLESLLTTSVISVDHFSRNHSFIIFVPWVCLTFFFYGRKKHASLVYHSYTVNYLEKTAFSKPVFWVFMELGGCFLVVLGVNNVWTFVFLWLLYPFLCLIRNIYS